MPDLPPPAERRSELSSFVASLADAAIVEQFPRYFAALCAWTYRMEGEDNVLCWTSPGKGLDAYDPAGGALPAPAAMPSGYDAGVFYHRASRALILVNRGTDSEVDWGANLGGYLGIGHKQFSDALDFAHKAYQAARAGGLDIRVLILTGHSLGGGIIEVQAACLPARFHAAGETAPDIQALGFASAPFQKEVAAAWAQNNPGAAQPQHWELTYPNIRHWTRKGDPIRSPVGYLGYGVIGAVNHDLPEVFTIFPNPQWMVDHHGATRWVLQVGRVPAHSIYRYFIYWGRPANQCVVVNRSGKDFPLATPAPDSPGFNSIPKEYR